MKPYITNPDINGRFVLPYQIEGEGIDCENMESMMAGAEIVAYSLPKTQSFEATWELRLYLNNNMLIDFSSSFTNIGTWQELGSLNMKFACGGVAGNIQSDKIYAYTEIDGFFINSIQSLIYSDKEVFSECGIVLINAVGQEVVIAAGVSPGSVSVKTPFCESDFEPEMEYGVYLKVPMKEVALTKSRFLKSTL